jgi:hypothetical protein
MQEPDTNCRRVRITKKLEFEDFILYYFAWYEKPMRAISHYKLDRRGFPGTTINPIVKENS